MVSSAAERQPTLNPLSAAEEEQKLSEFTREQWEGTAMWAGPRVKSTSDDRPSAQQKSRRYK